VLAKAAILCGGEGARLRPLTNYFQKTMIPIGHKRRPLLEYSVRLMVYHGIRDLIFLCGYRADEIENYFGDGARFGARVAYSRDAKPGVGSAQALMHALETGRVGRFDDLIVYYGDVLSLLDVTTLLEHKHKTRAAATLVLSRRYSVPVGVAEVSGERIVGFREKPRLDMNVTVGCLTMSESCIPVLRESTGGTGSRDLMTHFVPKLISRGLRVVPFFMDGFWYDIGTTEAYERLDIRRLEDDFKFLG
jgi:mannose-1-phosphate guanylyltransferase